ncbi:forkhead box protein C1 [Macrobrachium rosenbergii]|uniref:forkhead box protein C1 n=1 Tax=Macrobrachium rosenbergii TaxID=79674 RepID=UPI0034D6856C
MLTRREVIIEKPFRDRRYKDHRRKVRSALPRIDAGPPPEYPHLVLKLKKLRMETDRQGKICQDNLNLVHRMAIIMRTKRLDNINTAPRGPFEPRRLPRRRPPPPPRSASDDQEESSWDHSRSFLEHVTAEVDRHLRPLPPGKMIPHRAPAGLCRVPRVGPPPSPSSPKPRRKMGVPSISLTGTRLRGSPSPEATERSSGRFRRGREPTRLSPLPRRGRRPSISSPIFDENSSSAADDGDTEEEDDEEKTNGDDSDKEAGAQSDRSVGSAGSRKSGGQEAGGGEEATDSDDHVSSILLQQNPNITIDEASEDDCGQ